MKYKEVRAAGWKCMLAEVEADTRKKEERLHELRAVAKYLRKTIERKQHHEA